MDSEPTPQKIDHEIQIDGVTIRNSRFAFGDGQGRLWLTLSAPEPDAQVEALKLIYRDGVVRNFRDRGYSSERIEQELADYSDWFDEKFPDYAAKPIAFLTYRCELRLEITDRYRGQGDLHAFLMQNIDGQKLDPQNHNFEDRISQLK